MEEENRPLVLVRWRDTWSRSGWSDITDEDFPLIDTETVGWLHQHDEEIVIIYSSSNSQGGTGDIHAIPTSTISEMRVLEESTTYFEVKTKTKIKKVCQE